MKKRVGVAILGMGVVGGGTYRTLVDHRDFYLKTQNRGAILFCCIFLFKPKVFQQEWTSGYEKQKNNF